MAFRRYSTKQMVEGARKCNLCGNGMPQVMVCKCSVKMRLEGGSDVIEYALEQLSKVATVFLPAPYEYGGGIETDAYYITVYVANPDVPWDMEAINHLGRIIEPS